MDRTLSVISTSALFWFILGFNNLKAGDALNALKTQLTDPNNVLQSWDPTLVNPCGWDHVTCRFNSTTRVDLQNANLSGQLVPQLGQLTNLEYLQLHSNNITGRIPSEFGNLTSLVSLDLYWNRLDGVIPDTLGNLKKLLYLRLHNNTLTGTIPTSLTTIDSLEVLDLSSNCLSGVVPFYGSLSRFTLDSFANNPNLTGPNLTGPAPPNSQAASAGNIATRATVGGIAAFVAVLSLGLLIAWWRPRKPQCHVPTEEDPKVHLGQLKRFSLRELQVATDHFSNRNILGQGGFAKVYRGWLADGSSVVVKRLKDIQGGELQFQTEVKIISMAVHRNLLRLKGFCMTPTERLLVYPYMANGSVASCLRDQRDARAVLDWPISKRIALGSARGLAYLHDHFNPKIIHRDVKAANIFLDEEFEAVVGDFGLAKLVDYKDTHVTTAVHGTSKHIAPEYLSTGICSEKTDVFGYGVMLLELIVGQRVKGLLRDQKLKTLVDADLEGNYVDDEVELFLQVARLCTEIRASERPKMSEVVRMLEGEGSAERWKEWQKEENFRQDFSQTHNPNINWIMTDSNYNVSNDQLSGPR